jgi:hypothetical protein
LQVVQRALKMFEGEVQTAGIRMEFVISDSFANLNVDWVKIDPSRVLQVRQMCVLIQTTADLL